ncbi:unnamed protein product [Rotaria magnacalcarata]|nr:unnamed protein product [Rotaria magnacalcarata]CAF3999406.1 unnamed protein product [Rotaria magnacalcarata]CAF4141525.1 unnamed protein product [Rotaria magnacalcarata]CAF5020338.1 unnamed protein product [Rotaria magnacalcarata]
MSTKDFWEMHDFSRFKPPVSPRHPAPLIHGYRPRPMVSFSTPRRVSTSIRISLPTPPSLQSLNAPTAKGHFEFSINESNISGEQIIDRVILKVGTEAKSLTNCFT